MSTFLGARSLFCMFAVATSTTLTTSEVFAAGGPPETARDVLGVKIGMSPSDVRQVWAAHKPPMVDSAAGRDLSFPFEGLPNSKYEPKLTANAYLGPSSNHTLNLFFSAPPATSRLVSIWRTTLYGPTSSIAGDELRSALNEKFGPPSTTSQRNRFTEEYRWAWSKEGASLTADKTDRCKTGSNAFSGAINNVRRQTSAQNTVNMLKQFEFADCSFYAEATFQVENGVVTLLSMTVTDIGLAKSLGEQTIAAVNAITDAANQQQLEQAKTRKPEL